MMTWTYHEEYWEIRSELAIIDGTAMKGRRIIICFLLQKQILQQLHSNNIGTEKTRHLARELHYWMNINENIKNTIKLCVMYLEYQQTQAYEKKIPH